MTVDPLSHLLSELLEAEHAQMRRLLEEPGSPLLQPEAEAALNTMAAQAARRKQRSRGILPVTL